VDLCSYIHSVGARSSVDDTDRRGATSCVIYTLAFHIARVVFIRVHVS